MDRLNRVGYILLFLFSVFISAVSQILLKQSAGTVYENRWEEYLNPRVMIAYGIFFLSTLATMWAYKAVPLSLGAVLEATGYLWVTLLGVLFLKERVSVKKGLGLVLIVAGIIIFNL